MHILSDINIVIREGVNSTKPKDYWLAIVGAWRSQLDFHPANFHSMSPHVSIALLAIAFKWQQFSWNNIVYCCQKYFMHDNNISFQTTIFIRSHSVSTVQLINQQYILPGNSISFQATTFLAWDNISFQATIFLSWQSSWAWNQMLWLTMSGLSSIIALWGSCNGNLEIGFFHFWERNISGIFGHG